MVEIDQYAVKFYAQNYALDVGIKLEDQECQLHYDCGTRCCVKKIETDVKKYCTLINHEKNPVTKECSLFEEKEI